LSTQDDDVRDKLDAYRKNQTDTVLANPNPRV
jgi:phosphoribosylcarboxyaminoimidazole (NCAIR) mutase